MAAEHAAEAWLASFNPRARALSTLYRAGVPRRQIYAEMVDEILAAVRGGARVCAAFYGHPGVFVAPSHEAVRRAREEGYPARMLPAISAEDCLVADLGVDPGAHGWQSYEATSLLLRGHTPDPTAALVLWQVDATGKIDWDLEPGRRLCTRSPTGCSSSTLRSTRSCSTARRSIPIAEPVIERMRLGDMRALESTPGPTLYVPPLPQRPLDPAVAERLGLRPT